MVDWISGMASAFLPWKAASIVAATGAKRDPVASQTVPASAMSNVAAAKSPLHTVSIAIRLRRNESWSSAPTSRAS
jgi:hypothetical protein